jgi:hypothetical protein
MKMYRYAIFVLWFIFFGCVYPFINTTDVTNDSRYWGEYKPGLEVELIEDVYFNKKSNLLVSEKFYNKYSSKDIPFAWPTSFAEYLKDPAIYPEVKMLKKAGIIKCTKLLFIDNSDMSTIDIFGVLENGDFKNTTVSLKFLSLAANDSPKKGVYCLKPNPRYLKPVEKRVNN